MSDYPGQESRGIDARDVRPGDIIWNPHGGYHSLNERAMRPGVSRDRLEHAYMRAGRRQVLAQREAG